jgi:hypothetical protein
MSVAKRSGYNMKLILFIYPKELDVSTTHTMLYDISWTSQSYKRIIKSKEDVPIRQRHVERYT